MPEAPLELPRRHPLAGLLAPLLIYAALVSWQGWRMREQINPDAVSYIQNARYLAQGRLAESVSGYWSPLLSWCIAPLVYCGVDGLCAARVVLGVWGAGLVLASMALTRSLVRRSGWLGAGALCLIAVDAARLATCVISPDLAMAAILLAYCGTVAARRFADRTSLQVLAGLLGGAAYLAKILRPALFRGAFHLQCFPAVRGAARARGKRPRWPGRPACWPSSSSPHRGSAC
jgi:hypothetical protein